MRILGLVWVGLPTDAYKEAVLLFNDVLGLMTVFDTATSTELAAVNGDRVQLFQRADPYHALLSEAGVSAVPLFEVDTLADAEPELARAGFHLVGRIHRDSAWEWIDVAGPGGLFFELGVRRARG
jgi:catechol 2,3-dioxygenase-like lactoylglutathione lyase family enzyme